MDEEIGQTREQIEQARQRERARRILDVAEDLLLRWGYKRVTIDDIAKHAGVGKGTVYLHWKTRDALFETLLLRETVNILRDVLKRMYADPAEILLHRLMCAYLLILEDHPLIKALLTRDIELLGKLAQSDANSPVQARETMVMKEYFSLLHQHKLIRAGENPVEQAYAFNAATLGFFLTDSFLPAEEQLPLPAKANALARMIHLAFEPEDDPSPEVLQQVAPAVIQLFEQLCEHHELRMLAQTEI